MTLVRVIGHGFCIYVAFEANILPLGMSAVSLPLHAHCSSDGTHATAGGNGLELLADVNTASAAEANTTKGSTAKAGTGKASTTTQAAGIGSKATGTVAAVQVCCG